MASIQLVMPDCRGIVPVGQECRLVLTGHDPTVLTRLYVKVNNVFYPTPLKPWTGEAEFSFRPEAPGCYEITAIWRKDKLSGRSSCQFEVQASSRWKVHPVVAKVGGHSFYFPSTWEALLARDYEKGSFEMLDRIIKPGQIVYDIGANVGLYALQLARMVKPTGHVYCFDANPVCVYFLQANLAYNGIRNVDILPVAVAEQAKTCRFNLQYSNSHLGMGSESEFWGEKPGQVVDMNAASIDRMIADLKLPDPDVLKIDVEGAEAKVIRGMQHLLARKKPKVVIELHGPDAAKATSKQLVAHGYRLVDLKSQQEFGTVGEFMAWMPSACVQLLARAA